jgi:2-aminoadipate transaminase
MTVDYSQLYSDLAANMKVSAIRELLKYTNKPEVISFAGGLPNPGTFPIETMKRICTEVLDKWGTKALQYGETEGVPQLREYLKNDYRRSGEFKEGDELVITNGSQQALDLFGKVLLNQKDHLIAEAPTYLGGANAFLVYGAHVDHIEMDDDGMRVDDLEAILKRLKKAGTMPKFIYAIPTFQNPAGVTMPESRRKKLLDLVYQYDNLIILEDDPYGFLRFEGTHQRSLKELDTVGRVVSLKTISKVLAPGFRIGIVTGPQELVRKVVVAKQSADLCSVSFTQFVAWQFMEQGQIPGQLEMIRKMYRGKRDIMVKALKENMPEGVKWTYPQGGMFLWVTVEGVDTEELFMEAIKNNVAYVVGTAFYCDGRGKDSMRLNFSYAKDEDIVEGVKRLGNAIRTQRKAKLKK